MVASSTFKMANVTVNEKTMVTTVGEGLLAAAAPAPPP